MSRLNAILFSLLLLFSQIGFAIDDPTLLPPDQAFKVSVKAEKQGELEIFWSIADGYSLYRKNMRFESKTPNIKVGTAVFPTGKIKHDELLGDIEHYRNEMKVILPITTGKTSRSLELEARYQGCADIGVCYPPQIKTLAITLPSAKIIGANLSPVDSLVKGISGLKAELTQSELLPPDEAFQFFATVKNPTTLHVNWLIAEGYYQYREKTGVKLLSSKNITFGNYTIPNGVPKEDEAFGHVEIFHDELSFDIPLIRTETSPQQITLEAKYQGCADRGVCYPPMTKQVTLELPQTTLQALGNSQNISASLSEQDQITQSLHNDSLWVTLISFFGFGLLLAFTPCIFPMIPILSGIIVGKGHQITTKRAFLLSMSYVVASAMTYTVFGVLAALFGSNLQTTFQQPWIVTIFSGIFILLSLSMFGFYNLELPDFIRAKLHDSSEKHRDGSMLGTAIMGALSSLIVGPCVAAPLAGALIYIGQTGDAVLGGSALFMMGLGMGVPLLLLGASAGKLLPKAGSWLNSTKAVFGVVMLAVAVWMLSRILPPSITMLLWALLLILPAIYLNALDPLPEHSSGWRKLWKGVGITMLAYGLLLLIGFSVGNGNPIKPLQGFGVTSAKASEEGIQFERVSSLAQLEAKIQDAIVKNQPVMLDFYADWCISCKEMEAYTFTDPSVKQSIAGFLLLQVDVTKNSEEDKALLAKFNLIGPPAILFFKDSQQDNQPLRVIGYQDAKTFINTLRQVKS